MTSFYSISYVQRGQMNPAPMTYCFIASLCWNENVPGAEKNGRTTANMTKAWNSSDPLFLMLSVADRLFPFVFPEFRLMLAISLDVMARQRCLADLWSVLVLWTSLDDRLSGLNSAFRRPLVLGALSDSYQHWLGYWCAIQLSVVFPSHSLIWLLDMCWMPIQPDGWLSNPI